MSYKTTLQAELKTALAEIESLHIILIIATEKQKSLSATNNRTKSVSHAENHGECSFKWQIRGTGAAGTAGYGQRESQLDKTNQLQIRVNKLTAQNATLVEQLYQLKQLQGVQEGRKQNQQDTELFKQ